ncbi:MAG TPA: NUDIX domain-containing protein [Candidatus Dormibacteraeota bacterium]|nr:NUDIX domain-containing protein [Candidatus Dormibacteraeota bacterium]
MRKAVRAIVIKDDALLVMERNKFGLRYDTLIGGGIDFAETAEQSLRRELQEESGIEIDKPRLIFIEEAGNPYGTQYIYLCQYLSGQPALAKDSMEAKINSGGQNLYQPKWLPLKDLPQSNFLSANLKQAILEGIDKSWPTTVQVI